MGLIWDYFRETLRLPFIQKPGPLAMLSAGGADRLDIVRDEILAVRDQFFAPRCEDVYLVRFAASRGIARSPEEPEEHWRERVRFAYHWWARGGRESAMAEALMVGFGFVRAVVINMRAEDPARWASFRVMLTSGSTDDVPAVSVASIVWAINESKPARSKLAALQFATASGLYIGAGSVTGITVTTLPYLEE